MVWKNRVHVNFCVVADLYMCPQNSARGGKYPWGYVAYGGKCPGVTFLLPIAAHHHLTIIHLF